MAWPDDTAVPLPIGWESNYSNLPPGEVVSIGDAYAHYAYQEQQRAEDRLRSWVPGSFFDNFLVGNWRIINSTVGATDPVTGQHNPTWGEAWADTDRQIAGGWLPGGADNPLTDFLQKNGGGLLLAGLAIAAAVGRRKG